jgi:dTMP kinase
MSKQSQVKNSAQKKLKIQLRGRFIVIEGTDGSGKGTQINLLEERLRKEGVDLKIVDFPQYESNLYGKLVGRYLKGEFGGLEDVNPYLASLAYAGDRLLAKPQIEKWLAEGNLVIANRYELSNKAYMSARLPEDQRAEYASWLDDLEYNTNGLPKEELVVFLYVPPNIGQKNVDQKLKRNYLGNKKRDIMESDLNYLKEVANIYLSMAASNPNWAVIECTENGLMKSREEIHQQIVSILIEKGVLKNGN